MTKKIVSREDLSKVSNNAIDKVSQELQLDRNLFRATANYTDSTKLINIEVYSRGRTSHFFTANPKTLELTKIEI